MAVHLVEVLTTFCVNSVRPVKGSDMTSFPDSQCGSEQCCFADEIVELQGKMVKAFFSRMNYKIAAPSHHRQCSIDRQTLKNLEKESKQTAMKDIK